MKGQIGVADLVFCVIIFLSFLSMINVVYAEGNTKARIDTSGKVFVGLKYGNQDIDMQTQFTRRSSGVITEESSFDDKYTSNAGGLFVGYKLPYQRFYLSGQVFFDAFDDEFELFAGSSRYTSAINHALGIELLPGVYVYKGVSVFAKLGLSSGDFDFAKSSPTSTTYNVNRNLFGYTLGVGFPMILPRNLRQKWAMSGQGMKKLRLMRHLALELIKLWWNPGWNHFF
ncbi:MAG: hypothetical protein GY710_13225 [Desulfobacteraceae bacterium]|nr:hypothetical protein [Desulfobacteraceae bacterium]